MHEVKVYDRSGKLKEVISINALNRRENQQIENPSIFSKKKRFGRLGEKTVKGQEKPKTPNN
jgi:hypothetical protein